MIASIKRLAVINKNQSGFTLIELIVAIAITSIITLGIMMTIFQVMSGNVRNSGEMNVVSQVQNTGYWISSDIQMADEIYLDTDDPDTEDGIDVLVVYRTEFTTWSDEEVLSVKHRVTYNLTDDNRLMRYQWSTDAAEHTGGYPAINEFPNQESVTLIARDITVCDYNQGTNTLTVTASVGGWQPQTETRTYETMPRPAIIY